MKKLAEIECMMMNAKKLIWLSDIGFVSLKNQFRRKFLFNPHSHLKKFNIFRIP